MNIAPGSGTSTKNTSYALDLGALIDTLIFSGNFPRGTLASCSASLTLIQQDLGQGDSRLLNTQVLGQQIRTVKFTMR